jgi:hypothetical protein
MARHEKSVDVTKLGQAVSYSGIDPRVWATGGRILTEGDTVRWDSELGWVLSVEAFGGGLDGNTVVARFATNHPNEFIPLAKDTEVMLVVPEGDAGALPAVVGVMNNADGNDAPGEFTGLSVDGTLPATLPIVKFDSKAGVISPFDHELKKSPHNRREEYDGYYVIKAKDCVFEGDELRLQSRVASQSYVRGEDFVAAIGNAVTAMFGSGQVIHSITSVPIILAPTWAIPVTGGKALFELTLSLALSSKIKGE